LHNIAFCEKVVNRLLNEGGGGGEGVALGGEGLVKVGKEGGEFGRPGVAYHDGAAFLGGERQAAFDIAVHGGAGLLVINKNIALAYFYA